MRFTGARGDIGRQDGSGVLKFSFKYGIINIEWLSVKGIFQFGKYRVPDGLMFMGLRYNL